MRTLIASSAMALALTSTAFAASHSMETNTTAKADMSASTLKIEMLATDYHASDLLGKRLYMAESQNDLMVESLTGAEIAEWDDVGEIGDLLVTETGELKAVLLDIGGFLGIGEKTVAVEMNSLEFIQDGEDAEDFFVAFKGDRNLLEDAEDMTQASAAPVMEDSTETDMTTAMWDRPAMQTDGYMTIETNTITADLLTGATVYGPNDEAIGEVSDLILSEAGDVTEAKIDVGGFLGLGETEVLVKYDEIQIMQESDGDGVRVYVSATEDQLKQRSAVKS